MKKYALVTGATSGIGKEIALKLTQKGFSVIAVGRNQAELTILSEKYGMIPKVCDLSNRDECVSLWEKYKEYDICTLVNCAGFGYVSDFDKISIDDDVKMANVNVLAMQILTKLFSSSMKNGVILNVCSAAAFSPEPLMASYAASKSYVYSYSRAVDYALKRRNSNVRVRILCPGAVSTPFEKTAKVKNPLPSISAERCAEYAIKAIEGKRTVTVTGFKMKASRFLSRIAPEKLVLAVQYKIQGSKR